MEALYRNYGLLKVILSVGVISIILQIYGGYIQNKLLIQCRQVGEAKDPWIKMVIGKFKTCCSLHMPPKEVSLFVDRYLFAYRAHGVSIATWNSMGIYGTWLIGMLFGAVTLVGVAKGTNITTYVTYCIYTLLTVATIFGVEMFMQLQRKQEMIRTCLWDYLQNTLLPRIEQDANPEKKRQYLQEYFITEKESPAVANTNHTTPEASGKALAPRDQINPEASGVITEETGTVPEAFVSDMDNSSEEILTEIIQEYIS